MHILLVSHFTLPHVGGIEVWVDQLSRALAREGHEVTVVSSRSGARQEEHRNGVRIIQVAAWNGFEKRLHVPYPIFAPSLLPTLWRATRTADVLHVHGVLYLSSLLALFCAWWMGKPLVVTEHVGFVPYRSRLLSWIERLALALTTPLFLHYADSVIALNDKVWRWLAARTPHPERLHIVCYGVDTERFRPPSQDEREQARHNLGIASSARLALFVGRFVQKKRVDCVLGILDGTFELLLCGSGELPAALQPPGVRVVRDVPHERMPEVYQAADIFVLPSHGEGFPLSIMEAMACGLPVVAARDPNYTRYVNEDEMEQVEPQPAKLRAAIKQLLDNENERMRRGRAARARALSSFALAISAAEHLRLYEEARARRRLRNELSPLGTDLSTRIKIPVLRTLLAESQARPYVDIGPGSGYAAHETFPPGSIVAVDVSESNLLALRSAAARAGCAHRFLPVRADVTALPFRTDSLGTILCTEVLEHVANDRLAAAELVRTLAPSGVLIVEVPDASRGYASYLERLGIRTVHQNPGPEFHYRPGYTEKTLGEIFSTDSVRLARTRHSVGWLSQALIDAVALAHLLYERVYRGRSAWTWSDVTGLTQTQAFRLYRTVFPLFLLLAHLDRFLFRRTGFTLTARFEKLDIIGETDPASKGSERPASSA